jgi:putative ABC transport system permease protein
MTFFSGVRFVGRVIKENGSLRGLLSVLGVGVGLFSMVMVGCAVDSLSSNLFSALGSYSENVLFVSKIPFSSDSNGFKYDWWEYLQRPEISYDEYEYIERGIGDLGEVLYLKNSSAAVSSEYKSIESANFMILSSAEIGLLNLEVAQGRLISDFEFQKGSAVCMVPQKIADRLFGNISPVGKKIKVAGRWVEIVGITRSASATVLPLPGMQTGIIIPVNSSFSICGSADGGMIVASLSEGVQSSVAIDKIRVLLRGYRGLSPQTKDNFSVNGISYLLNAMESLFERIELIGNLIGGVSLAIGIFGIVNIMFVSVYQRRFIIGLKKALGARKSVIIREFLLESVVLSLLGGVVAIVAVMVVAFVINTVQDSFHFYLSFENILYGALISVASGIAAGSVPAWYAAKTDPVKVMRQ